MLLTLKKQYSGFNSDEGLKSEQRFVSKLRQSRQYVILTFSAL